jgi:hypothetical protein
MQLDSFLWVGKIDIFWDADANLALRAYTINIYCGCDFLIFLGRLRCANATLRYILKN